MHVGCLNDEERAAFQEVRMLAEKRANTLRREKMKKRHTFMVDVQREKKDQMDTTVPQFYYKCDFCCADEEQDKDWHDAEYKRLYEIEYKQKNAIVIGRVLRGFLSRFRYRRYQTAVVNFQATLRKYVRACSPLAVWLVWSLTPPPPAGTWSTGASRRTEGR
jgi:hypothetical protein